MAARPGSARRGTGIPRDQAGSHCLLLVSELEAHSPAQDVLELWDERELGR
jgi:hypothetical protein